MASRHTLSDESHHEKALGGKLLASVSRSFYLTLKALPRELREPISLAYLLARTADTIADTTAVRTSTRLKLLANFDQLIQSGTAASIETEGFAQQVRQEFATHQSDPAERSLMEHTQESLAWLGTMSGEVLANIRAVLATIISGQQADLTRFPSDSELHSLTTAAELDDYTYRVAGCVGEFWTKLCFSEMHSVFSPSITPALACELGIRFGKGLQLVNILRDIGKDAKLGRCYLPSEQWQAHGLTLEQIQQNPARLRPVWNSWFETAAEHLRAGLAYLQKIEHSKLRYATALPLILGIRTLAHLRKATDAQLLAGIKVSRLDVAKVLLDTTLSNSPDGLARLFDKQWSV